MSVIKSGRVDLKYMATHRFTLDQIEQAAAYDLFAHQRNGFLKIAAAKRRMGPDTRWSNTLDLHQ